MTAAKDILLEAKGLCAWYGAAQILYDVGLEVRRGEVVALMGRNGSGNNPGTSTRGLRQHEGTQPGEADPLKSEFYCWVLPWRRG